MLRLIFLRSPPTSILAPQVQVTEGDRSRSFRDFWVVRPHLGHLIGTLN